MTTGIRVITSPPSVEARLRTQRTQHQRRSGSWLGDSTLGSILRATRHGPAQRHSEMMQYRVRVRGHLDPTWTVWFDELTLTQTDDGTTELVGPLSDQSALYGLLARLRDLGATLLLVEQLA